MAKSTHILHNTTKPSIRQAAAEHEARARGTRGPEPKDQDWGPEPGGQNQAVDPEGKTGTQTRTDTELQQPDPERQRPWDDHRPEKQTEAGEGKEEVRTSK